MDNLVSLLRQHDELNTEVRSRILSLVQSWAIASEGRYTLVYINETYRSLQREGFRFPPRETLASSMIDSSAVSLEAAMNLFCLANNIFKPPEWADSDVCMRCRTSFTFTNRKHHCRNCGNVFCGACSSKSIPLPHLGITDSVRVDDGCYTKITEKDRRKVSSSPWDFSTSRTSRSHMQPRSARVEDGFDADLKKALEMSLEDAKAEGTSGYVPQSKPHTNGISKSSRVKEDDEDPELKAAIAASLQDMEEQKKKYAAELKEHSSNTASASVTAKPVRNDYELTPVEAENINLFATLVDRLQHQPPGTILREPQIQELYESIGTLRPKLARSYGETMSKHDTLLDLHSKLATVVRYYDRMLEERLNSTYNMQSYGGYGAPAPQSAQYSSTTYPTLSSQAQGGYNAPKTNVESYYTGNSMTSDSYARPSSVYASQAPAQESQYAAQNHMQSPQRAANVYGANAYVEQPPPPSAPPQSPYMQRHRQSSTSTASSQRAPSLKYRQPSADQVPGAHQRQSSSYGLTPQQQPPTTGFVAPQDQNTSYYYGNGNVQQQPPPDSSSNLYPTLQSASSEAPSSDSQPQYISTQSQSYPPQQHFTATQQPGHSQHLHQISQQALQQQQRQQQQQYTANVSQPQAYHHNPAQTVPLAPSAFPSAPTHQPIPAQPPPQPIEESLIDL